MVGTAAGAAKRDRCPNCYGFAHPTKPCPDKRPRGGVRRIFTEEDRAAQKERRREYVRAWRAKNRDRYYAQNKRDRDQLRTDVLGHYSDTKTPRCACCHETILEFLCLDHTNGGGNASRKAGGNKGGTAYYRRLRQDGFPPGYRVLCWNCNAAIGLHGSCPHQS